MYSGNSPTALRSIETMRDALLSLMKSNLYDKISVTDICHQAGLSRQTFYNCFDSKDDILRFYVRKCLNDIAQADELAGQNTDALEQNRELLALIVENRLVYLLFAEISMLVEARVSPSSPGRRTKDDAYHAVYLSGALTSVLAYWLRDPRRVSTLQILWIVRDILSGGHSGLTHVLPEAVRDAGRRPGQADRRP